MPGGRPSRWRADHSGCQRTITRQREEIERERAKNESLFIALHTVELNMVVEIRPDAWAYPICDQVSSMKHAINHAPDCPFSVLDEQTVKD